MHVQVILFDAVVKFYERHTTVVMERPVRDTIPFVSKPQCFDGKNWDSYKVHFTACVAANNWSTAESVSILSAKLIGEAALVLTQKQLSAWTYGELLKALDDRYSVTGPTYILKSKLRSTYQRPDQTVQSFGDELTTLVVGKLADYQEEQRRILEQFVEGLYHGHTSKSVARKQPTTLQEAIHLAQEHEQMHEWVHRREHKPEVVSPTATLEAINTQLREELRHERERAAAVQRQQGEQLAGMQQQLCDLTSRLHRSRQPEPRRGSTSRRRHASIKHRGKSTRRYVTDSTTTQTCTSNEDSGISDSTSESSIDIPSKYKVWSA